MEAIQTRKQPFRSEGVFGPGGYKPDRHLKLSVCRDFLKVAEHLLPPGTLRIPIPWHKDLHQDNIFVDPKNSTEIVGLID
jgi:Ser/Thr protein kinase RdoA (MazF antagonist)